MQTTVQSSELLQQRLSSLSIKEKKITEAISNRDFKTFAEITMKVLNKEYISASMFKTVRY
jgi:mevalonate pyrophosphate decarboxylase